MKTTVIKAGLVVATFMSGIDQAASKCASPIPPLNGINYNGSIVDLAFNETEQGTVLVQLTYVTKRDEASDTRLFAEKMDQQLPADSCGESVHRNGIKTYIADGSWHVDTSVTARIWLCIKTDGVCSKGLKFYKCTWVIRSEDIGFRKTLDVWTTITAAIQKQAGAVPSEDKYSVVVSAETDVESLQSWEKAIQDALKFVAKGLKFISFNLVDFTDKLEFAIPSTAQFQIVRESFPNIPNFSPIPVSAEYSNSPYGFGVYVNALSERSCSIAREIYRYFKNYEHFVYLQTDNDENYTISTGDNLWNIASDYYGDGRYFRYIVDYNKLGQPSRLSVGETIKLPTINRMAKRSKYVAGLGDSLWSLAEGDVTTWNQLKAAAKEIRPDVDDILPLDGFVSSE